MSKKLLSVPSIADMTSIKKALESTHQAFPVMNTAGHLIGLIPRVVLNELVKQKLFYDSSRLSTSNVNKISVNNKGTGLNQEEQEEELLDVEALRKANSQYEADYDEKEGGFPATPLSK